jgi:hypothetical protein
MALRDVSPDLPAHTPGTAKGEERVMRHGREPGRGDRHAHRTARDSTSINPEAENPIDPRMPHLPPA